MNITRFGAREPLTAELDQTQSGLDRVDLFDWLVREGFQASRSESPCTVVERKTGVGTVKLISLIRSLQ